MPAITCEESGFRLSAPDPAFRIGQFTSYRPAGSLGLREMDVGWVDAHSGRESRLLLLELKGIDVWSSPPDDPSKPHEYLVTTCVAKATDVLLMFACAWLPTAWGQTFAAELPTSVQRWPETRTIRLVFLIDIPPAARELLLPVRDAINGRLAGRLALFGIKRVSVVDFPTAVRMGLPVARTGTTSGNAPPKP